jgi:dienelactone hydrolase
MTKEDIMKIATLVTSFFLLTAGLFLLGAGPGDFTVTYPPIPCYNYEDEECSEITVTGPTKGNHELDCTVIQPWSVGHLPTEGSFPVISWANGWGYNDVLGEFITAGYKPGLIEWAIDGPYIVVAANQWSVQETDVLACVQWVLNEYAGIVNPEKIGLSGHSQGGGAVIKAGDGEPYGLDITATIPMNPWGPAWVDPGNQDGPMMLITGTDDPTSPVSKFEAVWEAIQTNEQGGLLAVLQGGTHNDDAWAPEGGDPEEYNFGRYQPITELWWQTHLNDHAASGRRLNRLLSRDPSWEWWYTDGFEE